MERDGFEIFEKRWKVLAASKYVGFDAQGYFGHYITYIRNGLNFDLMDDNRLTEGRKIDTACFENVTTFLLERME